MTLEQIKSFDVIGISVVTSNENGQAARDINLLWQRFYNESVIDRIPDKSGQHVYAVYSNYEGDHTKPYRLTIGCKVPTHTRTPENLHRVAIKNGPYQIFLSAGVQPQALIDTWTQIWTNNFPRAFQTDFEVYGPRFFEPGLHEVAVYIGMEPATARHEL